MFNQQIIKAMKTTYQIPRSEVVYLFGSNDVMQIDMNIIHHSGGAGSEGGGGFSEGDIAWQNLDKTSLKPRVDPDKVRQNFSGERGREDGR